MFTQPELNEARRSNHLFKYVMTRLGEYSGLQDHVKHRISQHRASSSRTSNDDRSAMNCLRWALQDEARQLRPHDLLVLRE